jgi:hypothetical protein
MSLRDGCGIYVVPSLIVTPYISQIRSARAPFLLAYLPDLLRPIIRKCAILGALTAWSPLLRWSLLCPCVAWAGSSFSVLVKSRGFGLTPSESECSLGESSLQLVPARNRPGPTGPHCARLSFRQGPGPHRACMSRWAPGLRPGRRSTVLVWARGGRLLW